MSEAARIELDTSAMQAYARYLKQAPAIAREEMEIAVLESVTQLQRELQELSTYTPKASGALQHSIFSALRGSPASLSGDVVGVVGTPLNYAVPVELGTKPHWIGKEGMESLQLWVKDKLGISGPEGKSIAFAIRNKISKVGTKGAHMFERAFKANEGQIKARIALAVQKIANRLTGGPA